MSSFSFSSASHSLAPYFLTKSILSLASWSLICFLRFHSSKALMSAFCFLSSASRWARWRSRALCCATSSPSCCMPSIDLLSCLDPSRAESRLPARVFAPSVIPNGSGMNHLSAWLVMNPMRADMAETTIMPIQNPPRPLLASSRSCSMPASSLSIFFSMASTWATSCPYLNRSI